MFELLLFDLAYYKVNLRNFFVYLNTQVVKLYQISDHNQSQTELEQQLENLKNHLAKIQYNPKMLEEFLEKGDDAVFLKEANQFFNYPRNSKVVEISQESKEAIQNNSFS